MNPKLRRFAIALSVTSFVGFGAWSGYSYDHYESGTSVGVGLELLSQDFQQKCVDAATAASGRAAICAEAKQFKEMGSYAQNDNNSRLSTAKTTLWLAIGIPCTIFFLLYAGTWIVTGRIRDTAAQSSPSE